MISGRSQKNSFVVITLYQESNCTCRKKNRFLFRCSIAVTRTIQTSLDVMLDKHLENYWNVDGEQELSDAWRGFTRFILLNEGHLMGAHGLGRDLHENKQLLVQMMYGQICGSVCPMQQKRKQNKNGPSRNQSSTMPDN